MSQIGDFLRDVRKRKGLSINEVAEGTGIRTQYLEALENGEYSKIPGDVFIKGFIRNYGKFLDLDGNALVEEYKKQTMNTGSRKPLNNKNLDVENLYEPISEEMGKNATRQKEESNTSKGRIGQAWQDIKDFIYDNIYETVEIDDDEEEDNAFATGYKKSGERKRLTDPAKAAASNKNTFFNSKVFLRVFAICLLLFVVFMSYFLLSSIKPFPKSTTIMTALKSAISAELASDKTAAKPEPIVKNVTAKNTTKPVETKASEPVEDKKSEVITTNNYKGNGVVVAITYKEPVWTQVSLDGKGVEANTVAKGVTKTYRANKEVKVTLGSIRNVEIKVNGNIVPYGEKEWGTVEKIFKK